jgi:tetratricopeptide (TPR) repeat protein
MNYFRASLVIVFLGTSALAQHIQLNGRLITDDKRRVRNTRVSVAGGQSGMTDANGRFSIDLSSDLKEGERVIITVGKVRGKDWIINHPLDGEWNLPKMELQNIQTLNVIIVPWGSKALWTHARIEKKLQEMSDRIAKLQRGGNQPKQIDFTEYMSELAKKYGSTPQATTAAFDEWAKAVEESSDHHVKGLVDFYNQNFTSSAENFKKAAQKGEENAAEDWKLAGNSASAAHDFQDAVGSYDHAKHMISRIKSPEKWAEVTYLIGIAKVELGVRIEGQEGLRMLSESVAAFREALLIKTRERQPEDWATTQNGLGNALQEQGNRAEPHESTQLLTEAAAAYRQALEVLTRERFPRVWAGTHLNLGNVLSQQGIRIAGPERAQPLSEAIAAYNRALLVFTRENFPKEWAATQMNLGNTLKELGIGTQGTESLRLLGEAEAAHRQALLVNHRERAPQEWAMATLNLVTTLKEQGTRVQGSESLRLLSEAVKTYRQALLVFTRETLPQEWAMTQNGLGTALKELGTRTEGQEGLRLLGEAVAAHRQTLSVYTREHLPQAWAMAQNNLARTFLDLKDWTNAAQSYANFLQVYPDAQLAYQRAGFLCHEITFNYEQAFALNRAWLESHPEDISALSNSAENHFTTSKFEQSQKLISSLLANDKVDPGIKVALGAIEIADLLALNKAHEVPLRMKTLIEIVKSQPADFKVQWGFEGTKHFIAQNEKLVAKDWLMRLFAAMAGENRDAIVAGLKAASESFIAKSYSHRVTNM